MENYIGYIYSITNEINGKTYIGKTNDLVRRWKEHYYGKGNTAILNNAFKKYGLNHFVFEIVVQIPFDNVDEMNKVLSQLEIYYIGLYESFGKGYNATAGGDGICFYKHSEKTKERLRQLQKEKWLNPELRAKMATAALGYHHTDDAKNRITEALLHRDPSIYNKIADKLRGKVRDHDIIMKAARKRRKPILQYNLDGDFIKEWEGASCIDGFEKTNIIACCKDKLLSSQGYIWKYKESNDFPRKINEINRWQAFKKPILQYDLQGNFVSEYESISEASRICGLDVTPIIQCLKGVYYTSGRYIWRYKEGKYPKHIEVPQVKHHWAKSVLQYNLGKELIAEYDNITTAANSTNIGRTSINNCLHGRSRTAGGYIWKFKEEEVI